MKSPNARATGTRRGTERHRDEPRAAGASTTAPARGHRSATRPGAPTTRRAPARRRRDHRVAFGSASGATARDRGRDRHRLHRGGRGRRRRGSRAAAADGAADGAAEDAAAAAPRPPAAGGPLTRPPPEPSAPDRSPDTRTRPGSGRATAGASHHSRGIAVRAPWSAVALLGFRGRGVADPDERFEGALGPTVVDRGGCGLNPGPRSDASPATTNAAAAFKTAMSRCEPFSPASTARIAYGVRGRVAAGKGVGRRAWDADSRADRA